MPKEVANYVRENHANKVRAELKKLVETVINEIAWYAEKYGTNGEIETSKTIKVLNFNDRPFIVKNIKAQPNCGGSYNVIINDDFTITQAENLLKVLSFLEIYFNKGND